MELERFHDGDNSLHQARLDQAGNTTINSPRVDSRRLSSPAEAERSTPSAATGAQPLPSTRRELRWAFPVDDSTARRIGRRSRSSGGTTSTAVRSSSLRRRATSPSPQPYPRERDGGNPRRRSRSTSGGAGFSSSSSSEMFARRQSSSLGPAAGPSNGGGVASSWRRRRRRQRQWGRPRKLCTAAVSRHVAQHTAGNLLASPRARNGVLLLAGAFAVSCSGLVLFLALWGIVLLAGAALWLRSEPMRTTLLPPPPSELTDSRFRRRGGAAQLWAAAAEVESDDGEGAVGGGDREGESTVAVSPRKWRDLVLLLTLAPPVLDATAQFCFLRLAARSCSAWLAVGLFIGSTVYACLVGASVVVAGVAELQRGEGRFRCLVASWHALLLLAAVGALIQQQWDRTVVHQGLGSVLLSLAAWQLGSLSARRVEGAVRYGLVATVQKALGEASSHELSPESLLELAAGRWLVEYWSQPPTFSPSELREMLVQAASSIARERLLGSTSRRGGDGGGRGRRGGDMQDTLLKDGVRDSPSLTEASSLTGGVEALTAWLEGRSIEPPVPRLWRPLETPASASPGWVLVSSDAPLLLRACPTLCAAVFFLMRSLVGGAPWVEWAFLLALAGPAAVEAWRLRVLRKELARKKLDHGPPPPPLARRTQAAAAAAATDRLSLLLQESNPPLENVWKNAVRLAEKLGEDPAGGGGGGVRPSPRVVDRVGAGVAMAGTADADRASTPEASTAVPKSSPPIGRDKADVFRAGLAARIGAERVLGGRPRLLKDYLAYSRPRSADSPAYPGRFTGSRTNNSLGLGLARPLAGSSGSLTGATATAVAPTAAPAPTAGVGTDAGLGEISAGIEGGADAATNATGAIPVRGDPGDDDAWDLFGATWAGTVVGAAGELAGAIGDVAGGALGSVPVLGGVLEWWGGGGGAPEKAEGPVSGGRGCEASAAEKEGTAVDGTAIAGGAIDGAANGCRSGGGGVESSGRRVDSSDHGGSESVGALFKAAEGNSGGTKTGMLHKAEESTAQEQRGQLVEYEAPSVADDASDTAGQRTEAKNPSVGAPPSIGDASSEENFDCESGSENEDRCEKQRPTSASLSPLYTINDTAATSSGKVPAQLPFGDDASNGDGQQQQQQQQRRESPCASTKTPSSACRDEGQGDESTTVPEEEHSEDHNEGSIVSSSSS
ncbi:unnamed protein product, partial [Ectocarpus fasciculatus]